MDFGKLASAEISFVDFRLPPDGMQTERTLSGRKPVLEPKFHVGCSRWGRQDWVGPLYPKRTKEAYMLDEYAKHFNTLELNAVFYSIPHPSLMGAWREKIANTANPDFLFLPKMSRAITHIKRLKDAEVPLAMFMESIAGLKPYLGPIFIQLGDNFGPKNFDVTREFIESLPAGQQYYMEFRHEEWFSNTTERKQLFNLLAEHKIGTVITDSSGRRDAVHMELTIPEVFVRFVGNGEAHRESDFKRIDDWVAKFKEWGDRGLEKVYFITHQHDQMEPYILAKYAIEQFNKYLGAELPEIKLLAEV